MSGPKGFFTDGQAYERLMGRWSRAAGAIFIDWLSVPKGLNWLDVGCGTGAFTELVVDRCAPAQITAIDPSDDQIAYVRSLPVSARAIFRVGDAQAVPVGNGEFDVATMALVISFIPDAPKAVAEMRRVVKPSGTAGAYMWDTLGKGFVQQPLAEALDAMNVEVLPNPLRKNSRIEEMRALFENAGFDQVATRTIEIEVHYPNFDDYWTSQTGLANGIVQAIRKLPEPDVARLKSYLREHLPTDRVSRIPPGPTPSKAACPHNSGCAVKELIELEVAEPVARSRVGVHLSFSSGAFAPVTGDVQRLLGRTPRSFSDFARDCAAEFR